MNTITCPKCNFQFEPTDAVRESVEKELRQKMQDWLKGQKEEFAKKEQILAEQLKGKDAEWENKMLAEKSRMQSELQEKIQKSLMLDFESKLRFLEQQNAEKEEKLKLAGRQELEMLQLKQEMKNQADRQQLEIEKRLLDERERIREVLVQEEKQKAEIKETQHQLQMKELQKQLEDQKGLIEQMKRKAEQGSMQMQGEVQEQLLEEILAKTFPFDKIEEVGKGVKGADCIQIIRNTTGQEAGKIIYESKRTKDFSLDWIEKFKTDMRSQQADVAILVTQAMPKDMDRFGEKDGVYICTFSEVRGVASILRNAILKIFEAKRGQENKGDKMVMLYDYLTGSEFSEQWKAIREGYLSMRMAIIKEREAMEKIWKSREKQLDKILISAVSIKGSIEGIAGADAVDMKGLDEASESLLLD